MFIDCQWVDTRWQWGHPVAVETPGDVQKILFSIDFPFLSHRKNYKPLHLMCPLSPT